MMGADKGECMGAGVIGWLLGVGTGASIVVLIADYREAQRDRRERALQEARRKAWSEPLRLYTHDY